MSQLEGPLLTTAWFPTGCVASPHHLASAAGHRVLAAGGNAVDAVVTANLVLSVVTPYHCGTGGDLLALVWDGRATGVQSIGAAPGGATPDVLRAAASPGGAEASLPGTDGMPALGALSVTVPGAIAGWAHLLDRWGTVSFGAAAAPAIRLAREGFVASAAAARRVERARPWLTGQPGWDDGYGRMRAGQRFVQPALARTLESVAADGPEAMYGGPLGEAVVATLREHGSTMSLQDLAAHEVQEVVPLSGGFRGVEVLELPPPTQGVTALTALGVLEALGPAASPELAAHHGIEAVRAAMADREEHLADPRFMRTTPAGLLDPDRLRELAAGIDPDRAADWPPARPAPGGTAYLCAADADGLLVSLIQSNFHGFGSGVVVPGTGIGLHNRGAQFSLDPDAPNAIAPGKWPAHTLIPALALHDGEPWLVFGTMGADGQPQSHVQLLGRLLDEALDVQEAISAPRWVVDVADGSVSVESRLPREVIDGLRRRGHDVRVLDAYDDLAGHAHAIRVADIGYAGGSDPRSEGAVTGW